MHILPKFLLLQKTQTQDPQQIKPQETYLEPLEIPKGKYLFLFSYLV